MPRRGSSNSSSRSSSNNRPPSRTGRATSSHVKTDRSSARSPATQLEAELGFKVDIEEQRQLLFQASSRQTSRRARRARKAAEFDSLYSTHREQLELERALRASLQESKKRPISATGSTSKAHTQQPRPAQHGTRVALKRGTPIGPNLTQPPLSTDDDSGSGSSDGDSYDDDDYQEEEEYINSDREDEGESDKACTPGEAVELDKAETEASEQHPPSAATSSKTKRARARRTSEAAADNDAATAATNTAVSLVPTVDTSDKVSAKRKKHRTLSASKQDKGPAPAATSQTLAATGATTGTASTKPSRRASRSSSEGRRGKAAKRTLGGSKRQSVNTSKTGSASTAAHTARRPSQSPSSPAPLLRHGNTTAHKRPEDQGQPVQAQPASRRQQPRRNVTERRFLLPAEEVITAITRPVCIAEPLVARNTTLVKQLKNQRL